MQLEFEPTSYAVALTKFNQFTARTPPPKKKKERMNKLNKVRIERNYKELQKKRKEKKEWMFFFEKKKQRKI